MILRHLAMITMAMVMIPACVGTFLGAGWVTDREIPIVTESVTLVTPAVAPGGLLTLNYRVNRLRQTAFHTDRFMVSSTGQRAVLPDVDFTQIPKLGQDDYSSTVEVPGYFSEGWATYTTLTEFSRNPIHRWFPIEGGVREVRFCVSRDGASSAAVCSTGSRPQGLEPNPSP